MFFGWKKVSPGFHLAATWLTAIGASISALWILIANAWMQYPVGMEFDPAQMRNVMTDFWAVVLSPVAMHKFFHAVFSGWVLAGVFVVGVSCWFLLKNRRREFALSSIKVGATVGLVGMIMTLWTGDGSAVDVAKVQPMKLAAMEGLYNGSCGQPISAIGIVNPAKTAENDEEPYLFDISIPYGLSLLATHNPHAFVPGINDLIEGIELTPQGDTIRHDSYATRIAMGKRAHESLRAFDAATAAGNKAAADSAAQALKEDYKYFGYGYLTSPAQAVPPVALTYYSFRIMVGIGSLLLLVLILALWIAVKRPSLLDRKWILWIGMICVPLVWVCSEAGWVVAEVGRQPWIIQDIMPVTAAVSDISAGSVQLTFWMFAVVFTAFLAAEIGIMLKQISKGSKSTDE